MVTNDLGGGLIYGNDEEWATVLDAIHHSFSCQFILWEVPGKESEEAYSPEVESYETHSGKAYFEVLSQVLEAFLGWEKESLFVFLGCPEEQKYRYQLGQEG